MIIKGQKINDRYQIIRTIGEGGMANVYLAYDTILDRNVAVKILRGDLADDEKFVRRFQREAIAASSLSHPNIVEMYDVGEDDGKYFIVMEYVDGKTLKNLIKKRGALTLSEVIDIMLQLTSAISCAHDSYIIHRDVKPQNVMILEDGRVKIMDFGIAMALNSNELTQTNSVMGSVHYLPPEQANGKGSTMKSDIYSLGILMFELLTGKLPFRGDQAVEIAIKQMKEPIPSVCKINPNIPQSIENIILKACAKNPKNRYDSVKEMREDIEKSMDPEHQFEERHVYKFPEQDLEETKIMPPIKDVKKEQPEEIIFLDEEEEKPKKEKKKKNNKKWLLVGGAVVSTLIILLLVFLLVLKPMFTKEKEIRIPNVKEMTLEQAKEIITNNGEINITLEIKEEYNDTVESGRVIETKPKIGNSVKVGTKITIIISKGKEGLEVVDYKNQKLSEIEEMLEKAGIIVKTEEREISEETDEDKDGVIVDQDVEVGTYLKNGDSITLTYNKLVAVYPDFTDGTWNEESIREFCERNDIIPTVKMVENGAQPEGTILSQSRAAKTKIYKNTSIVIEIAKKPTVVEKPPISDDQNDDNKEDGKDDIGNDESKTE
ncbi:MAG: Stk1 family PASTA domain-containing Ser/Thr kinase [Bacilli bacterium]|jgi:serine/threonine protein kinase|nr:Stk1 family PASTA domain-containing Ser/Thr kinase [Bacilli bacterium]